MYSKEESLKQLEKPVKNKAGKTVKKKGQTVYKTVLVPDFDKHDSFDLTLEEKGRKSETVKVMTRKAKPVKQVINMTEEAYTHMIEDIPPEFRGVWSSMSINQKLMWHCNRIAQSLGGTVESFQILD